VYVDIVADCGDVLVVVHGRDRRLTFSDRHSVPPATKSQIPLDATAIEQLEARRIWLDPETRRAPSATFVVDNNAIDSADAVPGNGVCLSTSGGCTFRAAIQEANALPGADTITFSLGTGTGVVF
jgi:hypothetical protein